MKVIETIKAGELICFSEGDYSDFEPRVLE